MRIQFLEWPQQAHKVVITVSCQVAPANSKFYKPCSDHLEAFRPHGPCMRMVGLSSSFVGFCCKVYKTHMWFIVTIGSKVWEVPVKLLSPIYNSLSKVRFPMFLDMLPVNLLTDNDNLRSHLHSHNPGGKCPESWLEVRYSSSRRGRSYWMSAGRLPDKLLFVKSIFLNEEMLKIKDGMDPVKEPLRALNISKLTRLPISAGITPAKS